MHYTLYTGFICSVTLNFLFVETVASNTSSLGSFSQIHKQDQKHRDRWTMRLLEAWWPSWSSPCCVFSSFWDDTLQDTKVIQPPDCLVAHF